VTVVEQGDCGLILRMIEGAHGFMALHHCHGFAAKGTAQAFKFLGQVRNVADGVFEDQAFQRIGVMNGVFDAEPTAPGVPEQMHTPQVQGLADGFDFFDITADFPQGNIGGSG